MAINARSYPSPAAEASADVSTSVYFSPKQPDGVKRGNWIEIGPNYWEIIADNLSKAGPRTTCAPCGI